MAKKLEKEELEVEAKPAVKAKLLPVDHDYGREDLNELRDKVNELIANS